MAMAPMPVTEDQPQPMDSGWRPYATIMTNDAGEFMLVDGDEPEPEDGTEPQGPTFPDGPALLKALMDKIEGRPDEEAAFAEGYEGGSDANGKRPPRAPMAA